MASELVHLSIDGGVATITLDSPANRNALSRALVRELSAALDGAEAGVADGSVRSRTDWASSTFRSRAGTSATLRSCTSRIRPGPSTYTVTAAKKSAAMQTRSARTDMGRASC